MDLFGPWELYWGKLYNPEDFQYGKVQKKEKVTTYFRPWTNQLNGDSKFPAQGYATYRMRIKVPPSSSKRIYTVHYSHLFSASKLFINGKFVHEKGKVSENLSEIVAIRTNSYAEFEVIGEEIEIILQIANRDFFRGGPRGEFLLSMLKPMGKFKIKIIILEMFAFGLIFGAAIYHFFIFILNRKQKAFLYFSLLCLAFLVRIPILNSKIYEHFVPIPSAHFIANFLHYNDIASFLFANLFLNALFQVKRKIWINYIFYIGTFISCFSPLFPSSFVFYFNISYVSLNLVIFVIQSILFLVLNKQNKQSLYFMGFGLFVFAVLCFLAISLNYYGLQGGLYLINAYMIYVVFQSLFISNYFANTVERSNKLKLQMQEEHQVALQKQRSEMQLMVHDQLGAGLTDLKMMIEKKVRSNESQTLDPIFPNLHNRVISILQSLRNQLLQLEDLDLIFQNFLTGVNLTLLRRYTNVGREFDFHVTKAAEVHFEDLKLHTEIRNYYLNIYYILYELCTNDLKYGLGESSWTIDVSSGKINIEQKNAVEHRNAESPHLKSIGNRIIGLQAKLAVKIGEKGFHVKLEIPLPKYG
ncbi:7TM-DISM domain-containing protein [Leptospira terpstrae]